MIARALDVADTFHFELEPSCRFEEACGSGERHRVLDPGAGIDLGESEHATVTVGDHAYGVFVDRSRLADSPVGSSCTHSAPAGYRIALDVVRL